MIIAVALCLLLAAAAAAAAVIFVVDEIGRQTDRVKTTDRQYILPVIVKNKTLYGPPIKLTV